MKIFDLMQAVLTIVIALGAVVIFAINVQRVPAFISVVLAFIAGVTISMAYNSVKELTKERD